VAFFLWGTFQAAVHAGLPADPATLILIHEGSLPIILSAPHGGSTAIPGVPARKGTNKKNFTTLRDAGTDELAEKIAAGLEKSLGGKPFVVIARFDRKSIDANRTAADAFESEDAKPAYDAYHRALSNACRTVLSQWGRGILLDIHGQSAESNAFIRGTSNGRTVSALVKRSGEPALAGRQSILGHLAGKGYAVIPGAGESRKEDSRYNGGFIVRTYGSHNINGVDAIQIELGRNLRSKDNLARTAEDLIEAIAVFAREYLPPTK
jgi:N-formylglutamate amidohydrolase